jgi:hypothetical protein
MKLVLAMLVFLFGFAASPQPQVDNAPPVQSGVSNLDSCKAGQGDSCLAYGQALVLACPNGGSALQQLQCHRKAQCYQNRGMQLKSKNPNPLTTDQCDAMLTGGSGDYITGVYLPVATWRWDDDLHAGNCTQSDGKLALQADGLVTWDAVVMTSTSTFGDIWHARFELDDADGVALGPLIDIDSQRFSPGAKVHWHGNSTFDKSLFPKIASVKEHSAC